MLGLRRRSPPCLELTSEPTKAMNAEAHHPTSSETPSSKRLRALKKLARNRERYHTEPAYRENKKALARKYELDHPDKVKLARKAFALSHKEHLQNYKRTWYEKNREKVLARMAESGRRRRKNFPDRVREISSRSNKRHIARRRAAKHRYRSTQANATGAHYTTSEHIRARWAMWGNRCWVCGDVATATDHVKPLNKGGSHWPANLRPICNVCNAKKKDSWPPFDLGTTTKPYSMKKTYVDAR